jgi:hypothetical protein
MLYCKESLPLITVQSTFPLQFTLPYFKAQVLSADLQLLSRYHTWWQYLTHDTTCLKILAIFLHILPFSSCKECKMSYIFSSVNSLNNGVKIDLPKWSEFVSSKQSGRKILCALTALSGNFTNCMWTLEHHISYSGVSCSYLTQTMHHPEQVPVLVFYLFFFVQQWTHELIFYDCLVYRSVKWHNWSMLLLT